MLSQIPNWIVNQWRAWYEFHNLLGDDADPEFRGDIRMAKGFAILANHWREKNPAQIPDLLPFPPSKPSQTPEQLQQALMAQSSPKGQSGIRHKSRLAKDVKSNVGTDSEIRDKTLPGPSRVHQGSKHRQRRSDLPQ